MNEMAYEFDPMKIKLKDLRTIEREFGVKMLKLIRTMEKSGGFNIEDMEVNELQAMVFISLAASGRNPTVESVGEMSLGEMVELLSTMEGVTEAVNPTTS